MLAIPLVRRLVSARRHSLLPAARSSWRRTFFATPWAGHGSDEHLEGKPTVNVVFVTAAGDRHAADGRVGESLLRVAQRHDVALEGACECSIACSTCHVILTSAHFDSLDYASEEEDDMLRRMTGKAAQRNPRKNGETEVLETDTIENIEF